MHSLRSDPEERVYELATIAEVKQRAQTALARDAALAEARKETARGFLLKEHLRAPADGSGHAAPELALVGRLHVSDIGQLQLVDATGAVMLHTAEPVSATCACAFSSSSSCGANMARACDRLTGS